MTIKVTVCGDMSGGENKLQLFQEEDGDVIVQVIEGNCIAAVQFCTLHGGGRSPEITAKLRELVQIIQEQDI